MSLLEVILIFVLQFEAGITGGPYHLYHRPGNNVTLPCDRVSDTCSNINWLYNRCQSPTIEVVCDGNVVKSSAQAARLSLYSNCSLGIRNITADDAGFYYCRPGRNTDQITYVYLNILTISASPSDADPQRDGDITLTCSLFRYSDLPVCPESSIRWVDGTGTVLLDRGVRNSGQSCHSVWTVKRQSGHNNKYICQFVEKKRVKIEAHYTPVSTDPTIPIKTTDPADSSSTKIFIMIGVVLGIVVVLVAVAALLIVYRRQAKRTEEAEKPFKLNGEPEDATYATVKDTDEEASPNYKDEPESSVTYAAINHANKKTSPKEKVTEEEEAVTYSAVKTRAKAKEESDPSSFYSNVR